MKQDELAEKLGISKIAVSYYENGKRNPLPSIVKKLSEMSYVHEEWIMNGTGEKFIPMTRARQIAELANKLYGTDTNSIEYRTMMYLKDMPKEDWEAFERFLNGVVKEFEL